MRVVARLALACALVVGAAGLCRVQPSKHYGPVRQGPGAAARLLAEFAPKIASMCSEAVMSDSAGFSSEGFSALQRHFAEPIFDKQYVIQILNHPDPRMRALAIAALAFRADPEVLPLIADKVRDKASTYRCGIAHGVESFVYSDRPTVGSFAAAVLLPYLQSANSDYTESMIGVPGFDTYWARHKNRSYSASWFEVRLRRASPWAEQERKREVLADVAKLPSPDRQWTLLWLAANHNNVATGESLIPDEEVVKICREIGRPALLRMLAEQIPSDDPDLRVGSGGIEHYRRMMDLVLEHAAQLLELGDVEELSRDEAIQSSRLRPDHRNADWASWPIARARLDPAHARSILHDALLKFQGRSGPDRGRIVASLWESGGAAEKQFVLNWFFSEVPASFDFEPRMSFVGSVAATPGGWSRLAALVADSRFAAVDGEALVPLASILKSRIRVDLISREEYSEYRDARSKREENQRLVARWRERIRTTASTWGAPGAPWDRVERW